MKIFEFYLKESVRLEGTEIVFKIYSQDFAHLPEGNFNFVSSAIDFKIISSSSPEIQRTVLYIGGREVNTFYRTVSYLGHDQTIYKKILYIMDELAKFFTESKKVLYELILTDKDTFAIVTGE